MRRYKSKYAKLLKTPLWTLDELDEIGWKLRAPIEEAQTQKVIIQRRIASLKETSELPSNYLRPEWVERDMKKMEGEYMRLKKSIKSRNAKDTTKERRESDEKNTFEAGLT